MRVFKGKISVIMPAFNEGHHIYENLRETHGVFCRSGRSFEIILVDDGSLDETSAEARRAAADFGRIVTLRLDRNRGKGNALKEGFRMAKGDFVIFLDADLDLHPGQIKSVVRVRRDDKSELRKGSMAHPGSGLAYPLRRK